MLPAATDRFVSEVRDAVQARLGGLLQASDAPPRIVEAVRYAALGGGKRFRALLCVASGEAAAPAGADPVALRDRLLTVASAIEMIHTFSLIHDDLPALDDDDLRRGRPTLHRRFDEATAILAGDALLNVAYETLAGCDGSPAWILQAIGTIGRAVGLGGMISGQVLDLEAEGVAVDADALHRIHALKTGALIRASCESGGIVAGAGETSIRMLGDYGAQVGLAFQIVDDILDIEGTAADLGKSPGKDAKASKATFPSMWGLEESRRRADQCIHRACAAVDPLGDRAGHLAALARSVLTRRG